jgi:hypothetical protein
MATATAAVVFPVDVFRSLCERHDLTYAFADDSATYCRGEEQYREIEAFARTHLPYPVARNLWNDVVLQKMTSPAFAEPFLWPTDMKGWS